MSYDFVGLAVTVDTARLSKIKTYNQALKALEPFAEQLRDPQVQAEYDHLEYYEHASVDTDPLTVLAEGLAWLTGAENSIRLPIPDTDYMLVVAGDFTWGDIPFEDFDAVCLLADAVAVVPGLAEATGVLGSGIRLAYPD